jgi:hypothetical protein
VVAVSSSVVIVEEATAVDVVDDSAVVSGSVVVSDCAVVVAAVVGVVAVAVVAGAADSSDLVHDTRISTATAVPSQIRDDVEPKTRFVAMLPVSLPGPGQRHKAWARRRAPGDPAATMRYRF